MTRKRLAKKAGIIIGGLVITALFVFASFYQDLTTDDYVGQETFQTEAEYTAFKAAIGNPDVNILDMEALSSAPPIVVTFDARTPADWSFPYGEQVSSLRGVQWLITLFAAGLFGAFIYFSTRV